MAQNKEEYVSFETAKLLKEKGFDERINKYYQLNCYNEPLRFTGEFFRWNRTPNKFCRPTQQMAMKWLREIHRWFIQIYYVGVTNKYEYSIYKTDNSIPHQPSIEVIPCDTYEDAVELSIKYCLERLI